PPQGIPKVDVSRLRYADELDEELRSLPDEKIGEQTQIVRPGMPLPPPTGTRDTGEISIWEAFGVKPPSQQDSEALDEIVKRETGEHKKVVVDDDETDEEDDTVTFSPLHPDLLRVRRIDTGEGLRLQQAREQVKVRRGKS
ncbi:MAG TPA: hypothetical protein VJZ27_07760, partial [Aggregatilineales bacterium]|nr:hypothetical protein [Aggregatilineales bacterium]